MSPVDEREPDSGDPAGFDFEKVGIGDADLFCKFSKRQKPVFGRFMIRYANHSFTI